MTRWLMTLTLAAALAAPLFLSPAPGTAQPASVGAPESSKPYWQNRYRELKNRMSNASARYTQAKRQYNKAKQRGRLRGDYKNSILDEMQSAEMDFEDAQKAFQALPDEARAAGVPPGWFREIDDDFAG